MPKRIRKRGAALSYFTINDNESGTCQLCSADVLLKNGSKAPLLRHLKAKHPDIDTVLISGGNQSTLSDEQSIQDIQTEDIQSSIQASLNIENIENIPMQVTGSSDDAQPRVSLF